MDEITYVIIAYGGGSDGFPIAYKLQEEGCEVIVGQIQDGKELGFDDWDEESKDKEARLKQYEGGIVEKMPAAKLIESLKKVEDKDRYFIYFEHNSFYKYAQELLDAGFTKGIFPLEEDYEFEKDREKAMRFVSENYPQVQMIPYEDFDTVDEAIDFLKKANKIYVIQSKGDYVGTMVPKTDDIDAEREQMINQLINKRVDYEKGDGIILKEKLIKPIEITPQIVFMDGEPVYTDLDIETKNIGEGENNGNQVGCGTNLIIRTEMEDKINEIAFPKAVFEMAILRTGIFVWDISLYIMPDGIFFGEFCPNRFGYDSVMSEITMAGGAKNFFAALLKSENPLIKKFGTGVRLFNLNRQEDREVIWEGENVYMYEIYKKDNSFLSLGCSWDLGVAAGAGNTILEAVDDVYETIENISFKELYHKTKHDFLDYYPTSIMFRFNETNGSLYNAGQLENVPEKFGYEKKIRDMEVGHATQMNGFRSRLHSILDED